MTDTGYTDEIVSPSKRLDLEDTSVSLDDVVKAVRQKPELQPRLAKYRLLKVLGRGRMGAVFEAWDLLLQRPVALKLFPKRFRSGEKADVDPFVGEARSAARVDHAHVVRVYEINLSSGWLFIAMELIRGVNLREAMVERGRLPWQQVCGIGADAAEGLAAAHRLGVIHRDIKPANLVLTPEGRCKVTDFGLAYVSKGDATDSPRESVGTPNYIAPEVALKRPATAASDLYSLAATLWHLLDGEPLYQGDQPKQVVLQHIKAPLPNLKQRRADLPDELIALFYRMLKRDPKQRTQHAQEVTQLLRRFANEGEQHDRTDTQTPLSELAQAANYPRKSQRDRSAASSRRNDRSSTRIKTTRTREKSSRKPMYLVMGSLAGMGLIAAVIYVFVSSMASTPQDTLPPTQTASLAPTIPDATPKQPMAVAPLPPVQQGQETAPAVIASTPVSTAVVPVTVEQTPDRAGTSAHAALAKNITGVRSQPAPVPATLEQKHERDGTSQEAALAKDIASVRSQPADPPVAADYQVAALLQPHQRDAMLQIINNKDQQNYGITGTVTRAQLSRSGKTFRIHLDEHEDNQSFVAAYKPEMYAQMAEAFGGEHGEGLLNQRVLIQGQLRRFFSSPQIVISHPQQITILE